jgi:hypothetical protein
MLSLFLLFLFLFDVVRCAYEGKANATAIELNTLTALSTTGSPNYFRFVLPSASFVSVSAKPGDSSNTASLQIDLIDAADSFFGSAGTPMGADLSALLLGGTYFLYMPNAIANFTLTVTTSVCGDDGVAAPPATNVDAASALDFYANRSAPISVWFCPPAVPDALFFRIRAPQPGTISVALSTEQQFAPIFGSTLALLAADGTTVLSACGGQPGARRPAWRAAAGWAPTGPGGTCRTPAASGGGRRRSWARE